MGKNYTDIMLDLETLATCPSAAILSISAVAFDPFDAAPDFNDMPFVDFKISLVGQENRTIDEDTLDWWAKQLPNTVEEILSDDNRVSIELALQEFSKFVWGKSRLWTQGILLDMSVLENVLSYYKMGFPWEYFTVRDTRTVFDLVNTSQSPKSHISIVDCYQQVFQLQEALRNLRITKFMR